MTGRKPIPTTLKILRGNPGKRPLPENEPKPKRAKLAAPRGMPKEQQAIWREIVGQLYDLGLATTLDKPAIEGLVYKVWQWKEAKRLIEKHGMLVKETFLRAGREITTVRISPAVRIEGQAFDQMMRAFAEYGMTASSRSRVEAVPPSSDSGKSPVTRPKARA